MFPVFYNLSDVASRSPCGWSLCVCPVSDCWSEGIFTVITRCSKTQDNPFVASDSAPTCLINSSLRYHYKEIWRLIHRLLMAGIHYVLPERFKLQSSAIVVLYRPSVVCRPITQPPDRNSHDGRIFVAILRHYLQALVTRSALPINTWWRPAHGHMEPCSSDKTD